MTMIRLPWVERRFSFGIPPGWMYNVLERLRGTPARVSAMIAGLPRSRLIERPGGKWSIQQHVGHLIDLETTLHDPRIDDFLARHTTLRAWVGSNELTENAGHNEREIAELVADLGRVRAHFVQRLAAMPDEVMDHQALHPRLEVMMRPVDMAFFVAEHDDHHLASIRELTG